MKRYILSILFSTALSAVFAFLKTKGLIDWNWAGVLLPIIIVLFVIIINSAINAIERWELKNRYKNK
jgi:uncharacterized protein YybS (DUF2232 family)